METTRPASPNLRLRQERIQRNWHQQKLADLLGTTQVTISRWEGGSQQPSAYFREKLCYLFSKNLEELGLVLEEQPLTYITPEDVLLWNVPFPRNPFFIGRDQVLAHLHTALTSKPTLAALTQSYSLHGLGGIGKTQLAIEYAYRHRSEYKAVLWVEAETQASLTSSFMALAGLFALPERKEEDQNKVVAAVLRWLNEHQGWLLIFDNVEDLSLLTSFLPASDRGALLLTTRLQTPGTLAQRIELPLMTIEEGRDFLLTRTHRLRHTLQHQSIDPQDLAVAQQIVAQMGGLPLALEQAGAYIEATQCGLPDYLHLFQAASQHMLDKHEILNPHPLSVSRTFMLAFERVAQRHPVAANLLTACTFLAPDAIPEAFFLEGASSLGATFEVMATNRFAFEEALTVLLSYSLIQRDAGTHTLSIHRLVQVVLKGQLSPGDWRSWAGRFTKTLAHLFPSDENMQADYWPVCEQLLSHSLVCLSYNEHENEMEVLALPLMNHVATYLTKRARYSEAEPLFARAIQRGECALDSWHPLIAEALNGLGTLYREQGKYEQAEPLLQRALCIYEQAWDPDHPQVASALNSLGDLYYEQDKHEQAESLFQRALRICEQAWGPDHPQVASTLRNLGRLYYEQGKYKQAEPLFRRALRISEQVLGSDHPQVAKSLNSLGLLYSDQGQYEQAEPLFQRALRIWEQAWGPDHPYVAIPLTNLGDLYYEQGKYEQTEPLLQRALHIWEQAWGPDHPVVAAPLGDLGRLYYEQGKYEQAEPLLQRALRIRENAVGADLPQVAMPLTNLGYLYFHLGRYEQAEPLFQRALRIWEQAWGPDHPRVAYSLNGLANLCRERGQYEQAESLYRQALELRQLRLGLLHQDVAETLYDLARLRQMQQHITEALSQYQQALTIREQILGPYHPKTLKTRRALLELEEQLRHAQDVAVKNDQGLEPENVLLCACGCGCQLDISKSRGEPRRFFSNACKQRFYRNASRQKRNASRQKRNATRVLDTEEFS